MYGVQMNLSASPALPGGCITFGVAPQLRCTVAGTKTSLSNGTRKGKLAWKPADHRRKGDTNFVSCPGISKRLRLGVRAISTNEFKTGTNIELDGVPWRVLEFLHVKPGKGAAFVRTKLKNYVTGNTVDRTFRAGEQISEATVQKDFKQFSYMDGDQFVFMDMETYEEVRLSDNEVGDKTKYLKEGMECSVLTWNDKVIDIDLPVTVKLKVTQADPGVKGDSAQGGSKVVTVETGAQVTVPLFVNQDDMIVIQTKDGSYASRG